MRATERVSRRRLLLWSTPIVTGHLLVVIWHLVLLVQVQPATPRFLPPVLILANLLPVAGVVALAKGSPHLAATLVTVPLGTAFVIGAYAHFLSAGSDNVLHMPADELTLWFQVSAVLLVVLEAVGTGLGLQLFVLRLAKRAPTV